MLPPFALSPIMILACVCNVTTPYLTFIQLINEVVGDMLELCGINRKVSLKLLEICLKVRHYYVTGNLDSNTIKKIKHRHKVSHKLIYHYLRPLFHQSIETPLSGRSNYSCQFTSNSDLVMTLDPL